MNVSAAEVRSLFDRKAAGWGSKYADGGPPRDRPFPIELARFFDASNGTSRRLPRFLIWDAAQESSLFRLPSKDIGYLVLISRRRCWSLRRQTMKMQGV
jgi:hypothetical protein